MTADSAPAVPRPPARQSSAPEITGAEAVVRSLELLGVTDVFGSLWPSMQKMGDPDGIAAMRAWLELHKAVDLPTYVAALTERDGVSWHD